MTLSHSSQPSQPSKHSLASHITALNSVLTRRPLGLVLDIDGTLSPIAPTPDGAYLYPGVQSLLEQVRDLSPDIHVAIMTGRGIADGAHIVNVDNITYIGTHGLEWSEGLPSTHPVQIVAEATRYIEPGKTLLDFAEQHLAEFPGVIVQRKNVGGTLHYRGASDHERTREQLLALMEEPTRQMGMRLGEGKMVVEILAPLTIDKGQGLRRYALQHDLRGIIFAGDDRTDIDAVLEAIRMRQEHPEQYATCTIAVQHHDTLPTLLEHADVIVQGVEGMAELLKFIVEKLATSVQ